MELWDPHFHIWDVSAHTQSGHDPQQLFAPDGNPVYTWDLYEQDMRAPVDFEHSGGAFVEAVSVCHVGTTGDAFAAACLAEATWASAQLANSRKSNVIVASAPLEAPNAGALLTKLADDPLVRGVRQIVNYRPSWPRNDQLGDLLTDRRWRDGYARLQDHAMSYDLQLNPHQFRTAAHLIETHPHIPVIVGHLGSPTLADLDENKDVYWDGLSALADQAQVSIKLSMLSYQDREWESNALVKETVLRVIELFGVDRCFFASNFPVEAHVGWDAARLYREYIELVADQYNERDQQKLFADNAKRVYNAPD